MSNILSSMHRWWRIRFSSKFKDDLLLDAVRILQPNATALAIQKEIARRGWRMDPSAIHQRLRLLELDHRVQSHWGDAATNVLGWRLNQFWVIPS